MRDDPAYEEAIQKIRGVKKDEDLGASIGGGRPASGSNVLIAPSVLRQTGYGASAFGKFNPSSTDLASPSMDPSNIRVRLHDKEDDDDLSNEENDIELDVD